MDYDYQLLKEAVIKKQAFSIGGLLGGALGMPFGPMGMMAGSHLGEKATAPGSFLGRLGKGVYNTFFGGGRRSPQRQGTASQYKPLTQSSPAPGTQKRISTPPPAPKKPVSPAAPKAPGLPGLQGGQSYSDWAKPQPPLVNAPQPAAPSPAPAPSQTPAPAPSPVARSNNVQAGPFSIPRSAIAAAQAKQNIGQAGANVAATAGKAASGVWKGMPTDRALSPAEQIYQRNLQNKGQPPSGDPPGTIRQKSRTGTGSMVYVPHQGGRVLSTQGGGARHAYNVMAQRTPAQGYSTPEARNLHALQNKYQQGYSQYGPTRRI